MYSALSLAGSLALAVLATGCCVEKAEYSSFVSAARAYHDAVAPIVAEVTSRDLAAGRIAPQTAKNRAGLDDDFVRALRDAEKRDEEVSK